MAVVKRGRERRLLGARGRKRRARAQEARDEGAPTFPLSLSLLTPATQATPISCKTGLVLGLQLFFYWL